MKYPISVFGIVLDGQITSSVIIIDRVTFMENKPFQTELEVSISALWENGKIIGVVDGAEFESESMSEALIEICTYCIRQMAYNLRDQISLKSEIEELTGS